MDKESGRSLMRWSVVVLHVWGTAIILAVSKAVISGKPIDPTIGAIFGSITLGIGLTLGVMTGDKGMIKVIEGKFSPREETETVTKTTTIPAKEPESAV